MEQGATRRATPVTTRALPASAPAVSSQALVGLKEPETVTVRHVVAPVVEIARNVKGEYSWTIKAPGETLAAAVDAALLADRSVRERLRPAATEGELTGRVGERERG